MWIIRRSHFDILYLSTYHNNEGCHVNIQIKHHFGHITINVLVYHSIFLPIYLTMLGPYNTCLKNSSNVKIFPNDMLKALPQNFHNILYSFFLQCYHQYLILKDWSIAQLYYITKKQRCHHNQAYTHSICKYNLQIIHEHVNISTYYICRKPQNTILRPRRFPP